MAATQSSRVGITALAGALILAMHGCEMPPRVTRAHGTSKVHAAGKAFLPAFLETTADDGQWTSAPKDYANTRFSALEEINASNVSRLKAALTFSTGMLNGHEATPLVVANTMYVVTPFPNVLYALDLTQPGAAVKWSYQPHPDPASQGVACCDVVNRGAAYGAGKVIINTLDNHTIAVDAATGRPVWNTLLGDINKGQTLTMAPFVVKDKVLIGNSGGELGVRGWLTALDLATGKIVWRAYSTGPDADVKLGPDFKPFYPMDPRPGPGRAHVAAGCLEDRRGHGMGLDLV